MKILPVKYNFAINKNKTNIQSETKENTYKTSTLPKYSMNFPFAFSGAFKPIYVIDEEGNYRMFRSIINAANTLNMTTQSIKNVLHKKTSSAKGYCFVYAYELEKRDSKGNLVIDDEKVKEIVKKTDFARKRRAIYSIDRNGNIIRYKSLAQAAEHHNTNRATILNIIEKKQRSIVSYFYVDAKEIEHRDENGKIVIDKDKLREIYKKANFVPKGRSVYMINKEGKYRRFDSVQEIERNFGINHTSIYAVLNGKSKMASGYTFVKADEVEFENQEGTLVLDAEKLKKLSSDAINEAMNKAVYAISKSGKCTKFYSVKEASKKLGIHTSYIYGVLNGRYKSACEYTFIHMNNVYREDENGKKVIDINKIKEAYCSAFKK